VLCEFALGNPASSARLTRVRGTETGYEPWRPGIVSPMPEDLLHLCTIFRPENVSTSLGEARELRGLTGLDYADLVAFRPERLALHELLVRVSADYSVPDGPRIEDLGINFRRIASEIFAHAVAPRRAEVATRYAAARHAISRHIAGELARLFPQPAAEAPGRALARWAAEARAAAEPARRCALRALTRVVAALLARHGRLWATEELIAAIALTIACNEGASEEIGRLIDPWMLESARACGHTLLPGQERPVVMNTKGASAAGKSSLRPLQRRLAGEIGTDWSEYALVSPDIWRKQLLDYGSLGAAYKYAGACTGDEVRIVDQKLDQYMARKAERGRMPHLLIDRFRFDSFAPDSDVAGSNLLTRFGSTVYLFFVITPPAELVERAWLRGLEVGRYKAVDDTLAHAVEAYAGIPELFFTWVQRSDKRVHFEFLDNSVPHGERPRTVAFGWNDTLVVLDVKSMLDVVRFRRIDVNATSPDQLFPEPRLLAPEHNTEFLRACVQRFREVTFAEPTRGRQYLRLESGAPAWSDPPVLREAIADADTAAGLRAAAGSIVTAAAAAQRERAAPTPLPAVERRHTVGAWGS
jgi:hypothetical protein